MKIVLEFDGNDIDFKDSIEAKEEEWDFFDSLYWEMDYGNGEGSYHHTAYGDIFIKVEEV